MFDNEIDEVRGGVCKVQIVKKRAAVSREELEELGLTVLSHSATGIVTQAVVKGTEDEILQKLAGMETDYVETVPLTLEEVFIYELEARGYGYESLSAN